jgi:hypothetical protein
MKVICAWCNGVMKDDPANQPVSHGICLECSFNFIHGTGIGLRQFLNGTPIPVLAMTADAKVLAANSAGLSALGKSQATIENQLSGVVIDCARSATGEGCGTHIECSACRLRGAIQATHHDGVARRGVISEHPLKGCEGQKTLRLTFSTARVSDLVMLTIEQREIVAPAGDDPDPPRSCAL